MPFKENKVVELVPNVTLNEVTVEKATTPTDSHTTTTNTTTELSLNTDSTLNELNNPTTINTVQPMEGLSQVTTSRGTVKAQAVAQQVIDGTVNGAMEGQSKITLTLNPGEIGTIRIQLTQRGSAAAGNQQLHARMVVNTPEAQQLLTNQMTRLQEKLGEHNIRLENLQVLVADNNGTVSSQASQQEQAFNNQQQQQQQQNGSGAEQQQRGQHHKQQSNQQRQQAAEAFSNAMSQHGLEVSSYAKENLGQAAEIASQKHPPAKGGATPPGWATTKVEGEHLRPNDRAGELDECRRPQAIRPPASD